MTQPKNTSKYGRQKAVQDNVVSLCLSFAVKVNSNTSSRRFKREYLHLYGKLRIDADHHLEHTLCLSCLTAIRS